MSCYVSSNVSGPCAECRQLADPVHIVASLVGERTRTRLCCKNCCPVHRQAEIDWQGEVKTIAGEQEGLF